MDEKKYLDVNIRYYTICGEYLGFSRNDAFKRKTSAETYSKILTDERKKFARKHTSELDWDFDNDVDDEHMHHRDSISIVIDQSKVNKKTIEQIKQFEKQLIERFDKLNEFIKHMEYFGIERCRIT